jgi:hypothetical protein
LANSPTIALKLTVRHDVFGRQIFDRSGFCPTQRALRDASFGRAFGVLIKELRLLARAVFVVDKEGVIRYIETVGELTNEPNYDAAIKAAKQLL